MPVEFGDPAFVCSAVYVLNIHDIYTHNTHCHRKQHLNEIIFYAYRILLFAPRNSERQHKDMVSALAECFGVILLAVAHIDNNFIHAAIFYV